MKSNFHITVFLLLILGVAAAGCGQRKQPAAANTDIPTPTAIPGPTVTPISTPTDVPTPTPAWDEYFPTFGDLCDAAISIGLGTDGVPSTDRLSGRKLLAITKREWDSAVDWERLQLVIPPSMEAGSPDDMDALVCIGQKTEFIGLYSDGEPGVRVDWEVRIADWPSGLVLGGTRFRGSDPPTFKTEPGVAFGEPPSDDFSSWLETLDVLPIPTAAPTPTVSPGQVGLDAHTDGVTGLAFSPDGKLLASTSLDNVAKLWDVATGEEVMTLPSNTEAGIFGVAFSPDGELLAIGACEELGDWLQGRRECNKGVTTLWQTADGVPAGTLEVRRGSIHSMVFSPNGDLLAAGGGSPTIWDLETGQLASEPSGDVDSLDFSPDGKLLATSNGKAIALRDVATGEEVDSLGKWVDFVAYSPDGKQLAATDYQGLKLWDLETGWALKAQPIEEELSSFAFSPNGELIAWAICGDEKEVYPSIDKCVKGDIHLWSVEDWASLGVLEGYTAPVTDLAFSPDGNVLASGGTDGRVILWEIPE